MEKQKNLEEGQLLGKFHQLRNQIDQQIRKKWQQQQNYIKKLIIQKNDFDWNIQTLTYIAGVDLSASKQNPDFACASLIIYNIKTKSQQYCDNRIIKINQPYVPGYLAFREVPPFYKMLCDLKLKRPQIYPQLILLDGNGILHSNYCGFASHLGVLLDVPTIGVGKTLFYIDGLTKDKVKEQCEKDIKKAGDYSLLKGDSGKVWGAALRNTQNAKNPIFVSIGTKIQLLLAIDIVKQLSIYRVVEPIRLADKKSRQIIEKADIKKLQSGQQVFQKFDMIYLKDKSKQSE